MKRSRTPAKHNQPPPRERPLLRLLRSPAPWRVAGVLALLGGSVLGLRTLDAYAVTNVDVQPTHIEWVDLPEWLRSEEWAYILDDIEYGRHLNPAGPLVYPDTAIHDRNVCGYVYEKVAESAWVQQVHRVVKRRDGGVRVNATFREPFAAVEQHGMAYLIDRDGVRLPVQWRAEFDPTAGWLRVRGVRAGIPALGEAWTGDDLRAGLSLIDFFYRNYTKGNTPFLNELRAVDVSEFDEILERLRIITINPRSYICWGHSPGRGYGVEATAEQKLATLAGLYLEWGRLPDKGPFSVQDAPRVMFVRTNAAGEMENRP